MLPVLASWLGYTLVQFRANTTHCWPCAGVAGSSSDTQNACGEDSAGVLREKHVKLSAQAGKPQEAGTKHALPLDGIQR
jgi:hypothetical protein